MKKSKIVPLNIGATSQQSQQFFGCEVLRSNRKTLALFISHRKVVVRCPHRAPIKEVQDFVNRNQKWIQARLEEESKKNKESLRIEKNGRIFYRARELTIGYKEGRKQRILINRDRFIIQGHKLDVTRATVQLEDHLIDKASEYIIPRAHGLARYLGVDQKIKEIKLRKTKSKWGHCTSTGVIQYNWLIMLAPYSIIDYMITHEICHLIHMDHSKQYWDLVASICPNYEYYIEWLKEQEHRFWF